MKKTILFFAIAMLAVSVGAQTPAPTPQTSHFSITGNIAGFTGANSTQGAQIVTAALQVTNRLSAGYEHISAPSINGRWEFGIVAYTLQLDSLLGSKISSKLKFDASQIGVTFSAGGGKLLQPTVNRIAETAGVHISYPLADHISVQLVGVDVLHGGVQTGFLTTNTTQAISTGLNLSF
jgi:hypothetical protein